MIFRNFASSPVVRLASLALAASILSGCVDPSVEAPSAEARQSLKLTGATVDYMPGALVHISAVEDEVSAQGGSREQVAQAERAQINRVLPEEFMAQVGPQLAGTRPVVARVHIRNFNIPGPLAAVMVGGSSGISAGIDLVDAKSGQVLNTIPPGKIGSTVYRPGGVIGLAVQIYDAKDPSEKKTREMARTFAAEYAAWIAPK